MSTKYDALSVRMKENYENRTRYALPRRTYTLIRADGRAFHTFTKNFDRPYDQKLMHHMDAAALSICESIPGARFAYVQSDEISVLLTDFETLATEAAFDGNVQKLASITASAATAGFNQSLATVRAVDLMLAAVQAEYMEIEAISRGAAPTVGLHAKYAQRFATSPVAQFDSRVFTIPLKVETYNCFLWRQQDAKRNAISMAAQAQFSHAELHGKNSDQMLEMLEQKKQPFTALPAGFRLGRIVERESYTEDVTYTHKRNGNTHIALDVVRHRWTVSDAPDFAADTDWLLSRIPENC